MTDQPSLIRVVDQSIPSQLPYLSDVMEKSAGEQKIAVQSRVMIHYHSRHFTDREGVLKKPADIAVVEVLGSGRLFEKPHELAIPKEALHNYPPER